MTPLRAWTAGLVALGLVVIAVTVGDYGINWDEGGQARYGDVVLEYFRSGEKGWEVRGDFAKIRYYGGLFEGAAALAVRASPEHKYAIRHLLTALTGLLCVVAVIRFGHRALGDAWIAVFASLALVTLPRFYGHAFMNSKDIPFACAFAWSLFAIWRFALRPDVWREAVLCGVAIGVTLAFRPGGLPLMFALFLLAALWAALAGRSPRVLAVRGLAAWGVAWVGMVAFWPWSHENPLLNPFRAVAVAASHPRIITVLFEGAVVASNETPRYYFAKYLLITTPPFVLLLLGVGTLRALWDLWRERWQPTSLALLLLGAWLLAPPLLAAISRPNVYDGVRHVLFVLPAAALVAGLGAATILRAAPSGARLAVAGAILLGLALPVRSLVTLHPYQHTYFNALVGGVRGAQDDYETEYWVTSYKEAVEWINRQADRDPERELRVLVAANPWSREAAFWYLADNVRAKPFYRWHPQGGLPPDVDYYLATTRYRLDENFAGAPIVHAIERDGAVFSVIRGRAQGAGSPGAEPPGEPVRPGLRGRTGPGLP